MVRFSCFWSLLVTLDHFSDLFGAPEIPCFKLAYRFATKPHTPEDLMPFAVCSVCTQRKNLQNTQHEVGWILNPLGSVIWSWHTTMGMCSMSILPDGCAFTPGRAGPAFPVTDRPPDAYASVRVGTAVFETEVQRFTSSPTPWRAPQTVDVHMLLWLGGLH